MRLLVWVVLIGCVEARSGTGAECSRNSQCAAPLVCALQACRAECNTVRDCPIGAACVLAADGFGVCQLPAEQSCSGNDDCPDTLVCVSEQCVNPCSSASVCPPGVDCVDGGCIDPSTGGCLSDGDCDSGFICQDGRCIRECLSDRDCRFGLRCRSGRCGASDASSDAPVIDAADAAIDAMGTDAGSSLCPPGSLAAIDVAVGESHACAVFEDGSVYCWGNNAAGQLGNATIARITLPVASAVRVDDITDAIAVRNGHSHSVVMHADGSVSCWGDSRSGQCGAGISDFIRSPERMIGVTASEIAPGELGTCVLQGTDVWCAGLQNGNALANGVTSGSTLTPVRASELPPARALAYWRSIGAVIGTDGALTTWGSFGVAAPAYEPLPFDDGIALELGERHLCVLRAEGTVYCAGDNTFGQLGDPSRADEETEFAQVPGLTDVVQIAGSKDTMCARTASNVVSCWGRNLSGALGVGDTVDRDVPTEVALPAPASDISSGRTAGCAIADGEVYCWTQSAPALLGYFPTRTPRTAPTAPVECVP